MITLDSFGQSLEFDRSDVASRLQLTGAMAVRSLADAGLSWQQLDDYSQTLPTIGTTLGPVGANAYYLDLGIMIADQDEPSKDVPLFGFKYNKPDAEAPKKREAGFRVIVPVGALAYGCFEAGHHGEDPTVYQPGIQIGTYNPINGLQIYDQGILEQQGVKFFSTDCMIGNLDTPVIAGGKGARGALRE